MTSYQEDLAKALAMSMTMAMTEGRNSRKRNRERLAHPEIKRKKKAPAQNANPTAVEQPNEASVQEQRGIVEEVKISAAAGVHPGKKKGKVDAVEKEEGKGKVVEPQEKGKVDVVEQQDIDKIGKQSIAAGVHPDKKKGKDEAVEKEEEKGKVVEPQEKGKVDVVEQQDIDKIGKQSVAVGVHPDKKKEKVEAVKQSVTKPFEAPPGVHPSNITTEKIMHLLEKDLVPVFFQRQVDEYYSLQKKITEAATNLEQLHAFKNQIEAKV